MKIKTIGFPRMPRKKGEKRDFSPELFQKLKEFKDIDIYIENDYGKGMGFSKNDYLDANKNIKFVSHEKTYEQDMVIVLRAPNKDDVNKMKKESVLISMLHFDTRPVRNKLLEEKQIIPFSMDSMVDDENNRMVVNYWGTSMSGARVAFNKLRETMPDFYSEIRRSINVTIIGFGRVGINAARAFNKLGDDEFYEKQIPGIIVRVLSRSTTRDIRALESILSDTDILIDASRRKDPSKIIIPNDLIKNMPEYAVILDLTADPYNDKIIPIQQKGIEGIPTGSLDKYVIEPNDDLYETIPKGVEKKYRRYVVSCNAWPGVYPKESMKVYGKQIYPYIKLLLEKGPYSIDLNSKDLYERALVRSSLDYYKNENQ